MTFRPLTKEDIGVATWNAEKAVLINHVRSAVEGLREELRKRPPMPAEVNWEAGHKKARQRALYLLDKWFPVFSQSLSEDAKINDSCSQQATSAPSSEAKSSVSHHVSMGAATESVANSEGRQQSMATCCRQQSEGSSPSLSNPHSQKHAARKGWHIPCYTVERGKQWPTCRAYGYGITCDCECHKDTHNKHYQNNEVKK